MYFLRNLSIGMFFKFFLRLTSIPVQMFCSFSFGMVSNISNCNNISIFFSHYPYLLVIVIKSLWVYWNVCWYVVWLADMVWHGVIATNMCEKEPQERLRYALFPIEIFQINLGASIRGGWGCTKFIEFVRFKNIEKTTCFCL